MEFELGLDRLANGLHEHPTLSVYVEQRVDGFFDRAKELASCSPTSPESTVQFLATDSLFPLVISCLEILFR